MGSEVSDYAASPGTNRLRAGAGDVHRFDARFRRITRLVRPSALRLTINVGHLHCQGETPFADFSALGVRLVNVHIERHAGRRA